MVKYAQLVMGPAGTGKSTFCATMQDHCASLRRTVRVCNLDPAAETFPYSMSFDIRDLISVDDVMDKDTLGLGPNGGLIYCMEHLVSDMDWLDECMATTGDDDYIIFDCPGQIELYSHVPVMRQVVEYLHTQDFRVVGVYLIDSLTVTDAAKLLSACLSALTAMIHLEIPHINVLSKCDLADPTQLDKFLEPDAASVVSELHAATGPRFKALNEAFGAVLTDYSLVSFVPLDISDDESVELCLAHIDNSIQYGEDMEPKDPADVDGDAAGAGGGSED